MKNTLKIGAPVLHLNKIAHPTPKLIILSIIIIHNIMLRLRADMRSLLVGPELVSVKPAALVDRDSDFCASASLGIPVLEAGFLKPRVDCLRLELESSVFLGASISDASLSL